MYKTLTICLAILCFWSCKRESPTLQPDKAQIEFKVPNLKFNQLLNSDVNTLALYDIEAEIVILDFWATWCGPCLQSFPKMSALQEKYGNQLKIIAVTDESPDRIASFLETRPQSFTVALDTDLTINAYFKHRVIPHYVILDEHKVVTAITDGEAITQENIEMLLEGATIEVAEKKEDTDFDPSISLVPNQTQPIFQSTLLPYNPSAGAMSNNGSKGNRLFAYNLPMPALFRMAYDFKYTRTKEQFKDPSQYSFDNTENRFCYEMIFPDRLRENRLVLMQQALNTLSKINASIEAIETEVYLLRRIPGKSKKLPSSVLTPDPHGITRYGEGITLQGEPMSKLADYYEEVMQLPVIDETGYNKTYDLQVKWYLENTQKGLDELKAYGLELKKDKRSIDFLILQD